MFASLASRNRKPTVTATVTKPDSENGAYRSHSGRSAVMTVSGRGGAGVAVSSPVAVATGDRSSSSTRSRAASPAVSASSLTPSLRRSVRPVPIVSSASPSSRCSGEAVMSTVRTRSRGTVSVSRRSRPFGAHGGTTARSPRRRFKGEPRRPCGRSSARAWSPRSSTDRPSAAPRARQSIHATE